MTTIYHEVFTKQGESLGQKQLALFSDPLGRHAHCWVDRDGYLYRCRNFRQAYLIEVKNAYRHVRIMNINYYQHRVVLIAWRGAPPPGYEADHINSQTLDNRLCNLRWLPRQENYARRRKSKKYQYTIAIHQFGYAQPIAVVHRVGDIRPYVAHYVQQAIMSHAPGHFYLRTRQYEFIVDKIVVS